MSQTHGNPVVRYLRRLGAGSLLISIVIHVVVLGLATVYVISTVQERRKALFQGGSGPGDAAPAAALVQHQVQMSRQQANLSALNQRLSVDSPDAVVGLPDLPDMPGFSAGGPTLDAGSGGFGAGIGAGAGFGKGPVMPAFGFRESQPGGALVGRFYDFKQLADAQPKPNPELARLAPGPLAERELSRFTPGSWTSRELARFYQAPTPLYATQIFIPNIGADEAPKAYGVGDTVQGRAWIVHYRARVSPPQSGVYRFVGGADDFLVVRVNGRVVLDGGLFAVSPFKTDRPDSASYPYEFRAPGNALQLSQRNGFVVGNTMDLRAGTFYDLDIVIGEGLGGHFYAALFVEKAGETYAKDRQGNPVLPLFRVADTPPPAATNGAPAFAPDGPVWRALAAPHN